MTAPIALPPMPPRIAKLPRNDRGYPVPFFVAWIDGKPDFRLVRPETLRDAVSRRLCWICGEALATNGTFALGPMCCVNRVNSEPPSHRECAEFAVRSCPFMLHPKMERREDERTRSANGTAGIMIPRNPGVMALWTTAEWRRFPDDKGRSLFRVGDPRHVSWWREGRPATRTEIEESISTGLPLLEEHCRDTVELAALRRETHRAYALVAATA